ncbi:hypothetical protein [Desulfolucanica intricata]|uniref:hypothetical protein n=1 Tax=Desulfolucanica intricata TaxID=1285191 RepID=UPI00083041E8|nr:hypothetical protein [Desulfolucanica intricata]
MNSSLPLPFPAIQIDEDKKQNPAIRLFGKRFISEQTIVEYLVEFLAVLFSEKKIGNDKIYSYLPSIEVIKEWDTTNYNLLYRAPVKLNLKLIAFLSLSRVDLRHETHKKHYEYLISKLKKQIVANNCQIEDVIEKIEELLHGFQGAGLNRTWCAQTFFPVTSTLIIRETIWKKSKEKQIHDWYDGINNYDINKHNFMARGGELLYLQLCNVFLTPQTAISDFAQPLELSDGEVNLHELHQSLQNNLPKLEGQHTFALDQLIDFIELLDTKTHTLTNSEDKWLTCAWCPRDSWQEGYLFAVEINRLLSALLDPVERLELLMTGCALQVLRSITAQSLRYAGPPDTKTSGSALGYAWIFSPPEASSRQQRLVSQRNLQVIQGLIQQALRHEELKERLKDHKKDLYHEADTKYGHHLFLSLGKKLGIIVPYKGSGARLIMTDTMLRYMVLVLLRPGERCTYDEFLNRLYLHFGIAIEGKELNEAMSWTGLPVNNMVQKSKDSWLVEMLRAGGFLTELSDAYSIVCNTFGEDK